MGTNMIPIPHHVNLDRITALNNPNCKIKNRERVDKILNAVIGGGAHQLQVITDFDRTLTRQITENGNPILSSFRMFEKSNSLPEDYVRKSEDLAAKYRPIEIDPHLSHDDKIKHMVEWWTLTAELLKGFPFDLKEMDDLAIKHGPPLRDGTHDLFKVLNTLNVPLLVFSAGLGDSILSVLKHAELMYPNVHIVSNFLQYKNGILDGLDNNTHTLIHLYNKNENALIGTDYYESVHGRKHVILMGDSLGDASMADGVSGDSSVLKIGFLFDHPEENLPKYLDAFDIVLVDDQTMDLPRQICKLVSEFTKND